MFQSVFLWFMPVICLVLVVEDCIEYWDIDYPDVLVSKCGKKNYVKSHLIKSFCFMFILVAAALFIDLLLLHILFKGGQFSPYNDENVISEFYQWEIDYPLLTNLLFVFITAFLYIAAGASCM